MAIDGSPVLCIFCLDQAMLRRDRNGRPFLDCPHCLARCFLRGRSEVALQVVQEFLAPYAPMMRERIRRRINDAVVKAEMDRLSAQGTPSSNRVRKKR